MQGLKRGKKKKVAKELSDAIRTSLREWRDTELVDHIYPGTQIISGSVLLGDDVVDQLATCREHIETEGDLVKHTRWYFGIDHNTSNLTAHGHLLLHQLQDVYSSYDTKVAEEAKVLASAVPHMVPPSSFYARLVEL
jgi:hypothetical protein